MIMLKKSKRTLSLVLALIMICSAMSVMAFAAEPEEEISKSCSFRIPTQDSNGRIRYTDASVYMEGGFSEVDQYAYVSYIDIDFIPDDNVFSYTLPTLTDCVSIYIKERYEDRMTGQIGIRNCYLLVVQMMVEGNVRITGTPYFGPNAYSTIVLDP